ncbi:MAG: T9SS type A sorting domain-containing protein [Chlorobi bacterium]|nr:T9SS type A sorting domain-containing protein [Chlorobiota bacterium]
MKKISAIFLWFLIPVYVFPQTNISPSYAIHKNRHPSSTLSNTETLNNIGFRDTIKHDWLNYIDIPMVYSDLPQGAAAKATAYRNRFSLPSGFPAIEVFNSDNPGPGYYIMNRMSQDPQIPFYLIIMDTVGFPVFYREFAYPNFISDFSFNEETGYLTYFSGIDQVYYSLDSSYQINNVYEAKNGYLADGHELRLWEDGSYWLMIYDDRIVDMSQIVPGGQVDAVVTGLIVQHIDDQGNVLFQWKSMDHIPITDADTAIVNLLANGIDYVHGNALDFDYDSNLLISSRNLSEITKVDISTGNIMWRLGGSQNQFQFIGDSILFSAQHHIRYRGDNLYSIYDNGFGRSFKFSRGVTYELDTNAMTATLVGDLNHLDSLVFSPFMGSNSIGPSNEHVLGWSYNNKRYVLTEFDSLYNISLEIRSIDTFGFVSYRAVKHLWQTNAISFDQDEYFIDQIHVNETSLLDIEIRNNLADDFVLNGFFSTDTAFTLVDELPITLSPGEAKNLQLLFHPLEERKYTSAISFYSDGQQERIAKQFRVNTALVLGYYESVSLSSSIDIWPNPAKNILNLESKGSNIQLIQIFDNLGRLVILKPNLSTNSVAIDVSALKKGVYIVDIQSDKTKVRKTLIVE